jgi:acetate kinase
MGVETLTLIANPGSSSRKYALYAGHEQRAHLHFEFENGGIVCTLQIGKESSRVDIGLDNLQGAAKHVIPLLAQAGVLHDQETISQIGLRVVAPSAYFLEDHLVDDLFLTKLKAAKKHAPLHIDATMDELRTLRKQFADTPVYGISDSAFHITKPDFAWNYGIRLEDADRYDIKRFGYHGLSLASVVHSLRAFEKLPPRVVVCHLGSGASVTAIYHGKSFDTTMGYSPLEGLIMATRSGSIDPTAAKVLQEELGLDHDAMQEYLNKQSGLLGLSGTSSDIRELLHYESNGDHRAGLALQTYVHAAQKAIGQMVAALGGVDILLFTGTVGERSFVMRERIVQKLHYLDFLLDGHTNRACEAPKELTCVSRLAHSRPIFVIPADEEAEMIRRISKL